LNSATGGVDSVTVAWSAPTSDGGSPITGYQIWRGTVAGTEVILTTVGVQGSYVDGTVADGVTYWYQVAAVNAVGGGPRSNELSASTVAPASAPTLLGAPADKAAALSWTVPSDNGGSAITGYNVYRRIGAATEGLLATTGPSTTTYVDLGLTNGTQYAYRVTALNGAGEGASSNVVTVVPTASATAPTAPLALQAAKGKGASTAIDLAWSAPASDGGSPVASYFVYRRSATETTFTFIGSTPNGTTRSFVDSTVARRTTYTYYVTAWNAYGPSPPSNEATIRSK
jgi:fibronectin type 3 domain-containing protein